MADEKKDGDENKADLLAAGPPPRPWSYILVGLSGAFALAVSAAILIHYFVLSRPMELAPTTTALSEHLVEVLTKGLVPAAAIKQSPAQIREETARRWTHYDFDVELPAALSLEGTRSLLIKGMEERQARVSSEDPLEFSIGPYPFARVSFHGGAKAESAPERPTIKTAEPVEEEAPATPEAVELRGTSLAIAAMTVDALRGAGVPEASLAVGDAVEDENELAVWMHTRIQVVDWAPPSVDTLVGAVVVAVAPNGGLVAKKSASLVAVTLDGHEVVEIDLGGEAPPATALTMPSTEKEDLRPAVASLVAAIHDGFVDGGVARDAIVALPSRNAEDSTAIWDLAHLQVKGGTTAAPEALLAAVMKRIGGPPAEGVVDESAGPPELHFKLKGHLVVIVELQPHAAPDAGKHGENLPPETMEGQAEGEVAVAAEPKGDPKHPQVAVILDDGGYGGASTETIFKLDPKLTLSILPHTPEGRATAERGAQLGFEIMLHMPMQAMDASQKYPGQLSVGMPEDEIVKLTDDALADIPGVKGINNHIGSKFTSDAASMAMFFQGIKDKPYFFIDSVTSGKSKAYDEAKAVGMRAAKRSVFLDDKADAAYIRKQFEILRAKAKKTGRAIAIGHFRPKTVSVLAEELEKIKRDGITLVHASELAQ